MEWLWELLKFSIYGSIGFVLGASWKGLCGINHIQDAKIANLYKCAMCGGELEHKEYSICKPCYYKEMNKPIDYID